jgi:hypothetical protein
MLKFSVLPKPKSPKQKNQAKAQAKAPKTQAQKPKAKGKKQKSLQPTLSRQHTVEQRLLGRGGHDIVAGKTCIPASLNISLGDSVVPLFLFCDGAVPILAYR